MIAQSIKWHIEEPGTDPGEIAILYRTNAQSRPLEDALRKIGYIPRIYGGTSFYDRRVKDAIAYLRLLVNPQSDIDFERIVNVPARAVGKTSIGKIRARCGAGRRTDVCRRGSYGSFWSLWSKPNGCGSLLRSSLRSFKALGRPLSQARISLESSRNS